MSSSRVGRRLERRVLALLPRRLALRVDGERARDGDDLGPLVHLHAGVGDEERALGELGLLLDHRLGAPEAVERVALEQRAEPLPGAARDEDMDAAERRPLDPLLGRVGVERPVEGDGDHRRCDLAAPARRRAVVLGGEERVVVAVAAGEVAHGVGRRRGQELPRAGGRPPADERLGPLDVVFLELVVGGLLELFRCRGRHGSPCRCPDLDAPKEYPKRPPGRPAAPDDRRADRCRRPAPATTAGGVVGRVSPRAGQGRSGTAPGRRRCGCAGSPRRRRRRRARAASSACGRTCPRSAGSRCPT